MITRLYSRFTEFIVALFVLVFVVHLIYKFNSQQTMKQSFFNECFIHIHNFFLLKKTMKPIASMYP